MVEEIFMSTREKLQKVLEFLINEEEDQARDLLHTVFVEKAREVHESLIESDDEEVDDDLEEVDENTDEE